MYCTFTGNKSLGKSLCPVVDRYHHSILLLLLFGDGVTSWLPFVNHNHRSRDLLQEAEMGKPRTIRDDASKSGHKSIVPLLHMNLYLPIHVHSIILNMYHVSAVPPSKRDEPLFWRHVIWAWRFQASCLSSWKANHACQVKYCT
ncbi:hypothetical protein L209DRAFT_102032 [Thermothelomyces heterothallicus CBS 203.75]